MKIAMQPASNGERRENWCPACDQSMPRSAALGRCETDKHNFSQNDKRRYFRAGGDERGARNRCALISIGRPEMERRGGDLEGESDKRHHEAGGEKRLDRQSVQLCADCGEAGRAAHAVNETQTEKREGARCAAEKEIFEARFRGARIGFVESGHDVKREAGELEPDENHEQLFTADEKHESDGGEQDEGEVFAPVARGTVAPRE